MASYCFCRDSQASRSLCLGCCTKQSRARPWTPLETNLGHISHSADLADLGSKCIKCGLRWHQALLLDCVACKLDPPLAHPFSGLTKSSATKPQLLVPGAGPGGTTPAEQQPLVPVKDFQQTSRSCNAHAVVCTLPLSLPLCVTACDTSTHARITFLNAPPS